MLIIRQYRIQGPATKGKVSKYGWWKPISHQAKQRQSARHRKSPRQLGSKLSAPGLRLDRRHDQRESTFLRHDLCKSRREIKDSHRKLAGEVQAEKQLVWIKVSKELHSLDRKRWRRPASSPIPDWHAHIDGCIAYFAYWADTVPSFAFYEPRNLKERTWWKRSSRFI